MGHPLDGKYSITTSSSYTGPVKKKSDGETEIIDGRTDRYDSSNCRWISVFEMISDDEVRMVSVADPSEAHVDFLLTAPDGSPAAGAVRYEAILKLSRNGDQIQMTGQIKYGYENVYLTMRSI
jgi:hypothetical protein